MKSLRTSSSRKRGKTERVFLLLVLLCAAAGVLSIACGPVRVGLGDILSALLRRTPSGTEDYIVTAVRLPRTAGCLLAGAAFAVSGAMIQAVLNNPLAAPNIIGVNAGAGFFVALWGVLFPAALALTPLAAFFGAFAGMLLVLFIAERGGTAKITLVLAGVAVSSIFSAGTDAVVVFAPDALSGYSDFRIGGFAGLTMAKLNPAGWGILLCLAASFAMARDLDILMLGSDTAQSLGLRVRPVRIAVLALAAALAGAAVSFSGLVGFVGIIVPHIMRRLVGEESGKLLPAAALGGAAFLTFCDLLSRLVFAPYELPVGIVLSFIGGPFFIWLLLRQRGGGGRV